MALPIGTMAQVVLADEYPSATFHEFEVGDIVVAGDVYPYNLEWQLFTNSEGETQYLLEEHYKVVESSPEDKPLDSTAKVKAVYAVLKEDGDIVATTADRDFARELKAAMGGKRKGVSIFQYTAAKEIR